MGAVVTLHLVSWSLLSCVCGVAGTVVRLHGVVVVVAVLCATYSVTVAIVSPCGVVLWWALEGRRPCIHWQEW